MLETPSSSCREGHIVLQFIGIFSFLPRESLSDSLCSVFQPPKDQRGYTRLGVFYFCMPDDGVKLIPLVAPKPADSWMRMRLRWKNGAREGQQHTGLANSRRQKERRESKKLLTVL